MSETNGGLQSFLMGLNGVARSPLLFYFSQNKAIFDRKYIMANSWKEWAISLKKNTYALYLATRDPRVPLIAKIIIGLVVAYALSPIDIIPDFIPILGYLDDLILLPIGIAFAVKLIPRQVWQDCRLRAETEITNNLPKSRKAAVIIVTLWVLALTLVCFVLWRWIRKPV